MKNHIFKFLFVFIFVSFSYSTKYYEGDGGKNLIIEISKPDLTNIGDESTWIPDFVVNTIIDDITRYSSISIVDTHNIDKISESLARDESGAFSDKNIIEVGNFTQAKSILLISIMGKTSNYGVSFKITDKETAKTVAAYNEANCSVEDLESGKVIKTAILDLFAQLGVNLTEEGKTKLLSINNEGIDKSIEAQKLFAKANIAEEKGNNLEALSLTVKANRMDNSLKRISQAKKKSYNKISVDGLGSDVRKKIELRKYFKSIIEDEREFYANNLPYIFIYDTEIKTGNINYEDETYSISFKSAILRNYEIDEAYNILNTKLKEQPDYNNWKLNVRDIYPYCNFMVEIEILDKNGTVVTQGNGKYNIGSNDICNINLNFTLSADVDTEDLTIRVKNISRKIDNTYKPVELLNITKNDYIENVLMNSLVIKPTGIKDVNIISVCVNSIDILKKYFNFPNLEEIINKKYKLVKKDEIVLTNSDLEILQKSYYGINSFYITNKENIFPRLKSEFKKEPLNYFNFKFVKIGESNYKFLTLTYEDIALLKAVYGDSILEKTENNYIYYPLWSLFSSSKEDYIRNFNRVYVYCYNKVFDLLKERYPNLLVLKNDNHIYTSSESGLKYGEKDDALYDFVKKHNDMNLVSGKYYVNENDIIIQPFYMIDPLIKIFSELSYTNFISNLKITNKFLNDEIIEIIKSEKPQYKIDTSFVILINALNDMYSCEPFALTKDGKSALNEEEIFAYDYNCSGFKLPTKEQLELFKKENPKQYKKLEKEAKKNNGKFNYVVF